MQAGGKVWDMGLAFNWEIYLISCLSLFFSPWVGSALSHPPRHAAVQESTNRLGGDGTCSWCIPAGMEVSAGPKEKSRAMKDGSDSVAGSRG